jgi:hypothetical protein
MGICAHAVRVGEPLSLGDLALAQQARQMFGAWRQSFSGRVRCGRFDLRHSEDPGVYEAIVVKNGVREILWQKLISDKH